MKVVLDAEALDDLDGIHAWIARDNPASADSTVDRIYDEIEHLGRSRVSGITGERVIHLNGS
jgi:plasmid stabilization system protein ParE